MDIGSIFLVLALAILVALFVARPFFENKSTAVTEKEHEISSLLAERDRVINALQELDFDYQLGKIPEEDYPRERTELMQTGADILRQLDTLQETGSAESAEDRLETVIAARRADAARVRQQVPVGASANSAGAPPNGSNHMLNGDDDLEAMIAARKRTKQDKPVGFCPQCGNPIQRSDKFCPRCGEKL